MVFTTRINNKGLFHRIVPTDQGHSLCFAPLSDFQSLPYAREQALRWHQGILNAQLLQKDFINIQWSKKPAGNVVSMLTRKTAATAPWISFKERASISATNQTPFRRITAESLSTRKKQSVYLLWTFSARSCILPIKRSDRQRPSTTARSNTATETTRDDSITTCGSVYTKVCGFRWSDT